MAAWAEMTPGRGAPAGLLIRMRSGGGSAWARWATELVRADVWRSFGGDGLVEAVVAGPGLCNLGWRTGGARVALACCMAGGRSLVRGGGREADPSREVDWRALGWRAGGG
jgi:hypothetical protein